MEVSRKTLEKDFNRFKVDEIPSNWYVPAKSLYNLTAVLLYHWSHEHKVRGGFQGADKMLYDTWEWIEEHAFSYGEEHENENGD